MKAANTNKVCNKTFAEVNANNFCVAEYLATDKKHCISLKDEDNANLQHR